MAVSETMEIQGIAFAVRSRSDAANATCRDEENLMAARDSMEDLRAAWGTPEVAKVAVLLGIDQWQAWLCTLPHLLAKHYGLKKDDVWAAWSRHHGATFASEVQARAHEQGI